MNKNIFCTYKQVFRKVFCTLAVIPICIWGVKSITPEELEKKISHAQTVFDAAELKLKLRAPRLTDFWLREKTNEEGHKAELEIRRLHPKEYMDYITAKIDLDDLLYTQYLIFVNGKAE